MTQVSVRRRATAAQTRVRTSVADRELEAMRAVVLDITSSKDKSEAFLRRAGVIDSKGRLKKHYRD